MATYNVGFVYELDQDGNSNNGHIDSLIPNSSATATETQSGFIDGLFTVNETFDVVFPDNSSLNGTYTYVGHDPSVQGLIGLKDGQYFMFSNNGSLPVGYNITNFSASPALLCFLPGTLIATPSGSRAVEELAIGDPVLTADGRSVPVKWLGRQSFETIFGMPEPRRPVLISAGVLGNDLPRRDLRVTSDHAVMIDGLLVQAGALVNGTTIRRLMRAEMGERLTVFHVETEGHEIILAEGVEVESFVDNVSRERFDNYAEYVELYGEPGQSMQELDAPRVKSWRQLPAPIRARLAVPAAA